jgi:predicted nuclease of predicted toxin-antitoxin system
VRIKLDENLPVSLAAALIERGHDVETVADEGLVGAADVSVLSHTVSEGRMIFTLDRGFGDVRAYPPGAHPGIIVLRPGDQSARAATQLALLLLEEHDLEDLMGTVAIAQPGRLRVRRPPSE